MLMVVKRFPGDLIQHFRHPFCPLPAGNTLSAALLLHKIHKILYHIHDAGFLIKYQYTPCTQYGSFPAERFITDRDIQLIGRNYAAVWSADMNRLEGMSLPAPSNNLLDQHLQTSSHGYLDQSPRTRPATHRKYLRSGALADSNISVPFRSVSNDMRNITECLDIIHHCGFLMKATF